MDRQGDVCHLVSRNVRPEWKTDPDRAILMSRANHILSDGRGYYCLKILDAETGERAMDAGRILLFVCYNWNHETILWTRKS